MSNEREGELEVDGQVISYACSAARPSVALLHGIPTSRYLWRNVANILSKSGVGWLAFDLLGYGNSAKPAHIDLGIEQQARLIASALSQLGWSGGTVVGHDIGGGVAQLLAISTSFVNKLVLVDSIAYDSFPEPGIARLKDPMWDDILGAVDFDLKKGFEKALRKGMVHSEKITREMIDAYELPFSSVDGRLAYLRAARSLRSEDLTSKISKIEQIACPSLLVSGSNDSFQPAQFSERLAAALPNATFHLIDGAGHFLPEDAPEELANLIVKFVTDTDDCRPVRAALHGLAARR